jgi:hypothetical protein
LARLALRACDVEHERPLAGEREVAARLFLQLLDVRRRSGRPDKLERVQVVVREHVGQVFCPLPRLALDPGRRRLVAGSEALRF